MVFSICLGPPGRFFCIHFQDEGDPFLPWASCMDRWPGAWLAHDGGWGWRTGGMVYMGAGDGLLQKTRTGRGGRLFFGRLSRRKPEGCWERGTSIGETGGRGELSRTVRKKQGRNRSGLIIPYLMFFTFLLSHFTLMVTLMLLVDVWMLALII